MKTLRVLFDDLLPFTVLFPVLLILMAAVFFGEAFRDEQGHQISAEMAARDLWLKECAKPLDECAKAWDDVYTLREIYGERVWQ